MNPSVVSRSRGVAHVGVGARGSTVECRDRDSQIVGIIRPVASQPPTLHDVEATREPDIEFNWEDETVEQWAYAR